MERYIIRNAQITSERNRANKSAPVAAPPLDAIKLVYLGVGDYSIRSAIIWRLVAIRGDCVALPLTAITRYVAQVSLTWKPPLSESSKAFEIESKETFRTSLNQRGAKVSLDLLKGYKLNTWRAGGPT